MTAGRFRQELLERVRRTVSARAMFAPGDLVVVAVSGGPDSMVLLDILHLLSAELRIKLHVFHLNHLIRGESAEVDARFVAAESVKRAVPVTSRRFDIKQYGKERSLSVQEAAREVRYRLMEETAEEVGAARIALGHHADDQVETFLMRIVRGTGLAGLRGIPASRGPYVRPLIDAWREEILQYAEEVGVSYRTDPTNEEPVYLRNRIRISLVPALTEFDPQIKKKIVYVAELAGQDESLLDELAEDTYGVVAETRQGGRRGEIVMARDKLAEKHISLRRRLVRKAIAEVKGDLRGIGLVHIAPAMRFIETGEGFECHLPQGVLVYSEYGNLVVSARKAPPAVEPIVLEVPGRTEMPSLGVAIVAEYERGRPRGDRTTACLDADRTILPLVVRTRQEGDRFQPHGMKGAKKLQDFLVDEKVPKRKRDLVPIVESKGEIAWVVGHRIDERFKAGDNCRNVLVLRAEGMATREE